MDLCLHPRARRRPLIAFAAGVAVALSTIAIGAEASSSDPSSVTPVDPVRILDTRTGIGAPVGKVGAGQTIALAVAGVDPIPANATGVVLNVTATDATAASYVSAWPAGGAQPDSSILNFTAGEDIANMITATLGDGGAINLFNSTGEVHLIADVAGYLTAAASGQPGPTGPQGIQGPQGPAGPGGTAISVDRNIGESATVTVHGVEIEFRCVNATSTILRFGVQPPAQLTMSSHIEFETPDVQDLSIVGPVANFETSNAQFIHALGVINVLPSGPNLQVDLYSLASGGSCRGRGSVIPLTTVAS